MTGRCALLRNENETTTPSGAAPIGGTAPGREVGRNVNRYKRAQAPEPTAAKGDIEPAVFFSVVS